MIGLLNAAAALLGFAGVSKLLRPGPSRSSLAPARIPGADRFSGPLTVRLMGALETGIAGAALVEGGRIGAALIAVSFAVLTAVSVRMVSVAAGEDCGCFGRPSQISRWHIAVNLSFALLGAVAMASTPGTMAEEFSHHFFSGIALGGASVALAYLCYLLMTAMPELLWASSTGEVHR